MGYYDFNLLIPRPLSFGLNLGASTDGSVDALVKQDHARPYVRVHASTHVSNTICPGL